MSNREELQLLKQQLSNLKHSGSTKKELLSYLQIEKSYSLGQSYEILRTLYPTKKSPLIQTHPDLMKEWNFEKNNSIDPRLVTFGSDKRVWWICKKDQSHEWQSTISNRTKIKSEKIGTGCPLCSGRKLENLKVSHPNLFNQIHPNKNFEINIDSLTSGSDKKIYWQCNKGEDHVWIATVSNRVRGTGCSICSGKKVVESNCLLNVNPLLASEWHPSKNGILTSKMFTRGSKKKVWWQCHKNMSHEWPAQISSRQSGHGCPFCAKLKINLENSLASKYPEIASQWHPTKNGNLTADQIAPRAKKKYWWKCNMADDHEWEASVDNRQKGGCSICAKWVTVTSNALTTTHPDLIREWHPIKNDSIRPDDFNAGSNRKVWWKCAKAEDHEWDAKINSRTRQNASGCPCCANLKIVNSNCLATTHPKLVEEWASDKNAISPFNVVWGSRQKVFWRCKNDVNHVWEASISNRASKREQGCPSCRITNQSKDEIKIIFELISIFKNINKKGEVFRIKNKTVRVDIFIPSIKLVVEYDGSFWHSNKQKKDLEKSEMLTNEGYNLIRLRQKPLEKLNENDILTEMEFNGKDTVNKLLISILNKFSIDEESKEKIHWYLKQNALQNQNEAIKYIESLKRKNESLTED